MPRSIVVGLLVVVSALTAAAPASGVTAGTPPSREYPHLAALLDDGSQYCDASLIAPTWLLTAAHCTEDIAVKTLTAEIGAQYLEGSATWAVTDAQNEVRSVSQVIAHPSYDPDTLRYDVALLRLSSASTKTPIPVASPATDKPTWAAGKPARVVGYGLPSGQLLGAPFQADVTMQSDSDCERSYQFTGPVDTATMVCAGEVYGVKDSCFGDSGGPLMAPVSGTRDTGKLIQVGVVSWGTACGLPTQYGVYSRVGDNPLNSWIAGKVRPRRAKRR